MEFKGTKGKWELDPHDKTIVRSTNADNGNIAECHTPNEHCDHLAYISDGTHWGENEEIAKANAQLIATAPELLEALIKCKEVLQDNLKAWQYKNEVTMLEAFNLAETTITRALGKEGEDEV